MERQKGTWWKSECWINECEYIYEKHKNIIYRIKEEYDGMMEEIRKKLKLILQDVIEEFAIDLSKIEDSSILSDFGMNSIYFVLFVIQIEEGFEIEFEDEYLDMDHFSTFGDIVNYIYQKILFWEVDVNEWKCVMDIISLISYDMLVILMLYFVNSERFAWAQILV